MSWLNALVKDGADESRGVGLLPVQGQSEACVDLVLQEILKDEVWSDVKRVSETHCVLPGVGVVKEGFPDLGPHLRQLSNHPYNCVLDTQALTDLGKLLICVVSPKTRISSSKQLH